MALSAVGSSMTITEATRLAQILADDPTSQTFVSINAWKFPASREFFALADIFDAYARVHFKDPDPHVRPQPDQSAQRDRFGDVIRPADLADVLRAFGREVPEGVS